MAFFRIGQRNDDDYHKSKYATKPEDEDPSEITSFVKPFLPVTSTSFNGEHIEIPTLSYFYSAQMSNVGPDRPWTTRFSLGRPTSTVTEDDDDDDYSRSYEPTPTSRPATQSKSKYYGINGLQSSSPMTTHTLTPTAHSSPAPTNDSIPDLQHNGVDNGSDRIPIYAAAGVTPVVVLFIGFFVFFCLRKRRRQRQGAAHHGHIEEMKQQPKPLVMPYIVPPSPPPVAALPDYSPTSLSHPPTASSSQPVILGPIPSGNNGAYLTGMDTSDLVSMTSAGGISRNGTVVDRDPFADGRSLEDGPPPYRPSSLPPASIATTSRTSSVRIAAPPASSRTHLIERNPFEDPEDDEVSEISGHTLGRNVDGMSEISDLSYQIDPVVGRTPF